MSCLGLQNTYVIQIFSQFNYCQIKSKSIKCSILEFSDAVATKILPLGDNTLSDSSNTLILNSTIDYIISTKRFDDFILTIG